VGDLDRRGHAADQHVLVASVELVGLARREDERHEGQRRDGRALPLPAFGVAAHCVVAALVAEIPQRLEHLAGERQVGGTAPVAAFDATLRRSTF